MAEKYSNTGTTTTSRNEVATLLRITKKATENANKTISNRTSEKTGISETDVKDQRLQTTPEVEDKSNKNQQDVPHLQSNQRVQKKHAVEDKTNKNQQDVAQLQSNQKTTEQFDWISQKTSLLQDDIKLPEVIQDMEIIELQVIQDMEIIELQDIQMKLQDLAWVERSYKTSGPFYNDVYGKDYDDSINNSGRSSVKTGTNSAVAGVSDQNIGISILLMDTGDKDQKTTEQFVRIDKILSQEIQDIKMKLQGRKIYIEAEKANFQTVKKRLHTYMYDNKYMESVEALGKEFHAQIDEYKKCLFSAMLLIDNDEKTHQHFGKNEKMELKKLIKKVKQLQSQLLKKNQLIELENTELVQKKDELKEQVKTELLADNVLSRRTKIRNAKSKMNFSSVYRAYYLYRKNNLARMLVSLEQLIEALDSIKSPHYIWPSGHPLILSKERQIELDFFSNEYMERLHSFLNGRNRWHRTWNSDQIVRPEPMVLAGFRYDGEDDKVVCKSCGAISDVNDWSDDDEDYAFTMHRRTGSSHCEFLRKFDSWRSNM